MAGKKWQMIEWTFEGPHTGNPFVDVELWADFYFKHRKVTVRGFYDGNGVYKIRFLPDEEGSWRFETRSSCPELDHIERLFEVAAQAPDQHGLVQVDKETHFAFQDGTPYFPFGTTAYVWNHQSPEMQQKTLASFAAAPFNKVRMCVFPKYYDYNTTEPAIYPFEGQPLHISDGHFDGKDWMVKENGFDFTRFVPDFFQQLDQQIVALGEMGIQVDLILFHPYDHWGFASMGEEADLRYLRYLLARVAAFPNVWFALANEYDLMALVGQKERTAWDELFKCVKEEDPYGHLASIHNFYHPPLHFTDHTHWYDHHKSWVSHVSIQHDTMFFVPGWLKEYRKPIMIDECRYEGNLNHGWGNLTAEAMTSQFWLAICHGGYATHGETYLNEDGSIFWAHGGTLKGASVERIAFLRSLVEENNWQFEPLGSESSHWETAAGIAEDGTVLVYLGADSQASFKIFDILPEEKTYTVNLIDTWNMTTQPLEIVADAATKIALPAKPYLALQFTEIESTY
ncbi:DUF5060 domain-containing protein [Listeria costaricensis]|uniref:DUF5060 domain-containing protein n=1 Tax=Listeria costaricensis TaxID=2026604 RepID=UPI000C0881DD|nr:DUF5060 domain-containing protein [Listeria costaricensis]